MDINQEQKEKQVQLVVFTLDEEEYASSVDDIREVITIPEITPVPGSPAFIAGIINLRGKVIPIVDLEKRFLLTRDNKELQSKNIIVVDENDAPFGIMVDEVLEVLRVQADSIHEAPISVSSKVGSIYIKGVVVLEDPTSIPLSGTSDNKPAEAEAPGHVVNKRVLLLLNVKKILSTEDKQNVSDNTANNVSNINNVNRSEV